MKSQPQQAAKWNQHVEEPLGFYDWSDVPVINQDRTHRLAARRAKPSYFFSDLLGNLASNLALPLDLHNIVAVVRLYQHVNLHTTPASAGTAEWRGRFYERIAEVKSRNNLRAVVDNHVFKLKPDYGIPARKSIN